MRPHLLHEELKEALDRAPESSGKRAVLDRFAATLNTLAAQEVASETPSRSREKITAFLDDVEASYERLGARMFHLAFVVNVVGDAMVKSELISQPAVEVIQVGLYFYGFDQIERKWSAQAAIYSGIHADHLADYLSREGLKSMFTAAAERRAANRVFCLTYHYLNSLRKAYWKYCRRSEDALDIAVAATVHEGSEGLELAAPEVELTPEPTDRVSLVMKVFHDALSPHQRWIYLAKNRSLLADQQPVDSTALQSLLADLGDTKEGADLGWTEIAASLGINEKTAKREYLRSLHLILHGCATEVFGQERIPSHFVRRVLEAIRTVVHEKDLRLRDTTGRGLNTLVEKWEVALRFVLNHARVSA